MRRLVFPLAAGLFLAVAADACPPRPVRLAPPMVWCPPPVVFAPCPVLLGPPVSFAAPTPVAPAPRSAPKVEADPPVDIPKPPTKAAAESTPFRPAAPEVKPAGPPVLPTPELTIPPTKTAAPLVPTDPKGLDLKPVAPADPTAPPLVIPTPKERTSQSSPVTTGGAFSVRLVPTAGPAPASPAAKRSVVFVNLSGVDVVLTVEGETAVLPARHELTATVPAEFQWRLNGGEPRDAAVPTAAPGAEVVIR